MSLPPKPDADGMAEERIWAVIVTYRPDPRLLSALLDALAPQVTGGIIVNNGHELCLDERALADRGFTLEHLGANLGIAAALNHGIRHVRERGASHVIFFDQDSEPAPDMVVQLQEALGELERRGDSPGAVGPSYMDRRSGKTADVLAADTQRCRKMMPAPVSGSMEVDMLITSGSLIPLAVLEEVGLMREELFIDHVDVEWCFRARHAGYRSFVVGEAKLMHSIGDNIMPFLTRDVIVHAPIRHYYMLRNGIALQRLPHMSSTWRRNISLTLLKQFIFFSVFVPKRRVRFALMLRGIRDGLRGRLGPCTAPSVKPGLPERSHS